MFSLSRRQLVFGGAATGSLGALLYSLAPGAAPARSPRVELTPVEAPAPLTSAAVVAAPAPVPVPVPVSAEGLRLYGVSGGGAAGLAALIGRADGGQRVVPLGRDYRPGLRLAELGPSWAVLVSAGVSTRLELGGAVRTKSSASAPAAASPASAALTMDSADLRVGMAARRMNGRIDGFAIKQGADLAPLLRAGLRPGDVLVAVNGQPFDSGEKLIELPREIAGSYTAEFEFERGGRRMKASLPVNPRKDL